jgi:hypothetical protein
MERSGKGLRLSELFGFVGLAGLLEYLGCQHNDSTNSMNPITAFRPKVSVEKFLGYSRK